MRQSWASASRAFSSSPSPSMDERIRLQRVVKKRPVFPAPSVAVSGDMEPILSEISPALKPNRAGTGGEVVLVNCQLGGRGDEGQPGFTLVLVKAVFCH